MNWHVVVTVLLSVHTVFALPMVSKHIKFASKDEAHQLSTDRLEDIHVDGGILREGDILEMPKNRQAVKSRLATWTGRIIPYQIDSNFEDDERDTIVNAIYEFHGKIGTECIMFREKKDDDIDYVTIIKAMNESLVGRLGGPQTLSLTSKCVEETGTIFHELMHTLGFYHEHTRPDRDKYVKVLWDNIEEVHFIGCAIHHGCAEKMDTLRFSYTGADIAFHKMSERNVVLLDDYDYYSVMHFSLDAYHKKENLKTMEPLDTSVNQQWIGQRYNLSSADIRKVRKLYSCDIKECLPPGTLLNGVIAKDSNAGFGVGSTVAYKCNGGLSLIGPSTRQCTDNSTWTGDTPVCMDQSIYHYCNFDESSKCGWETSWKWTSYPTRVENTGPTWDHTFESSKGSYVYADGTVLMEKGNLTLMSPTLVYVPNVKYCLTFTYSMRGDGMGNLQVSIDACGNLQLLKNLTGDQGQEWKRAIMRMYFPCTFRDPEKFNIIFNAEKGDNLFSDIAIDDVLIANCTTLSEFLDQQEHNKKTTGDYAMPWPT